PMIRQNNCLGAGLLVWAALMCGHGWAQTKPAGENVKLQRLLDRFPKADANGDGILTQREAEEYKKVKGRGKMDEPIAGDATLALWIALHDDLADPSSADAVLQCSSRVTCASLHSGTAGLESQYFKKQAGVSKQGAALWQLFSATSQAEFDSPTKQALAREA